MDKPGSQGERGSSRIFSIEPHDHERLAQALGVAKSEYQIKWWWKYGQPAIDLIKASIEVSAEQVGSTVGGFLKLNGPEMQVTAACFPYGIPKPEGFRVDLEIAAKTG